jgi:hypothetical protein
MLMRTFTAVVLGAGLVLGVTACGDDGGADARPSVGTATTTVTSATASAGAPAPAPSVTTSGAPADKPAAKPTGEPPEASSRLGSSDGCPVTSAKLLAAWKSTSGAATVGPAKLGTIECVDGYAIAKAERGADAETEVEVFKYAKGTWHYLVGGTADYCTGVPAGVSKQFRAKGYGSCN